MRSTIALPALAWLIAAALLAGCSTTDTTDGVSRTARHDSSGPPPDEPGPSVAVATLNVLHGNPIAVGACAANDQCGAPDRVDLLMRHLEDQGCPEVVTLQEVDTRIEQLIDESLPRTCHGMYSSSLLADETVSLGIDREMILTTGSIRSETLLDLPSVPWSAHYASISSPIGEIDLVTTHLASGVNNPGCTETDCAAFCEPDDDANLCGARQVLHQLDSVRDDGRVQVITGDLNASPDAPTLEVFTDAGFMDTVAASGHGGCSGGDRSACTSGRSEADLTDPTAHTDARIDYVLVRPTPGCEVDPGADDVAVWAARPAEPVGASGVVFVSDHDGVLADLSCA